MYVWCIRLASVWILTHITSPRLCFYFRWQWHKFKDMFHFYTMVGLIPVGLIIFYTNVFIGPAQLTPTPDGYTPKYWEYHRHPITRFIARYIHNNPQQVRYYFTLLGGQYVTLVKFLHKPYRASKNKIQEPGLNVMNVFINLYFRTLSSCSNQWYNSANHGQWSDLGVQLFKKS